MKLLLLSVLTILGAISCTNGLHLIGLEDIIHSTTDFYNGIAHDIINKLPTAMGFFELTKQVIAGYPFELVSSAINMMCSSALSSQTIAPKYTPDINKLQFQLRTACDKQSFPLLHANDMWTSPKFDATKKVVILATGWTTQVNETDTIDAFAQAYNCRGDVNFVALDAASFVDTMYTWAAFNTEDLGMHIAVGLQQLIKIVPVENIHLIGHSLGAHIMGAAGRHFQTMTNKTLPRITGLDPAKPCFNEGETLTGLLRGDADFVDIIHSNPGVLGKSDPIGDIDFYPGGLQPLPPGCFSIVCAHARSWEYYAESVYPGNEQNFLGARCSSMIKLREHKCPNKEVPMGYAVPTHVKGNFFLEVHSESPFGMNGNPHRSQNLRDCGLCKKA